MISTNKGICKKYFAHKHDVHLKASTDVKVSTFWGEKWGDEAVDHKVGL